MTNGQTIEDLGELNLIVAAVQAPGDVLLQAALTKGIAHIGITGPSTLEESEVFISRALLRQDAQWKWVDATKHGRLVRLSGDMSRSREF
ncbi:hypothetical protein [Brevibacillus fortis]|uniref:hypothetical protein n=1 Tax=Brevibacillus fortis TaxID=2126352 RepID=UPI002688D256